MDIGDFIINGVSSREISAKIQRRPILAIPQRKTQENGDIPFRSGALIIDDEGYQNTMMELSLYVKGQSFEEASFNRNRVIQLFQQGQYNKFTPYFDRDKVYYVRMVSGSFNGERQYGHTQPVQLVLSVKPFKRLLSAHPQTFTYAGKIYNPTTFDSQPKITVIGSGNIDLHIGDTTVSLNAVDTEIVLDSELMTAYKMVNGQAVSQNDRMTSLDFPALVPGVSQIGWTGTVSELTIEPRWNVLV